MHLGGEHLDFTLTQYKQVLRTIKLLGVDVFGVGDYLVERPSNHPILLLRHDVDHYPARALRLAQLESELGFRSTYYFRAIPSVFNPTIMKAIASLGHEVGYHYETLDITKGNFQQAAELFRAELDRFRAVVPIRTVCSHGNSIAIRNGYQANRDLFVQKAGLLDELDLLGEAYLNIDIPTFVYVADNGRTWPYKYKWSDVPRFLTAGQSVYCSLHPDWWTGVLLSAGYNAKQTVRPMVGFLRKRLIRDQRSN